MKGTLLLNIGTPDSPRPPDVRRYLRAFLSDPRVLNRPAWQRRLLLELVILPFRPKESARAYEAIWTPGGSPLLVVSRRLAAALEEATGRVTRCAMRYGAPGIGEVIDELAGIGVDELIVAPLFPQYAMSSYESALAAAQQELARHPGIRWVELLPFFDDPRYLDALAERIAPALDPAPDLLLFSYHGVPESQILARDPSGLYCLQRTDCCGRDHPARGMCYRAQCLATTRALVARLGWPAAKTQNSFQSRILREPWLSPYTDLVLAELPGRGVRSVAVVCPAFVVDCLETLEEIAMRGRETFLEAGGEVFTFIPCLNDEPYWVRALAAMIEDVQLPTGGTSVEERSDQWVREGAE